MYCFCNTRHRRAFLDSAISLLLLIAFFAEITTDCLPVCSQLVWIFQHRKENFMYLHGAFFTDTMLFSTIVSFSVRKESAMLRDQTVTAYPAATWTSNN
jgi:hypothetical protein